MTGALIIGHGAFSESLLATLRLISGAVDKVAYVSNEGLSRTELVEKIELVSAELDADELLMFVDAFGGSCWQAAKMLKNENNHIITGVNLPMMLSYVNKRNSHSLDDLCEILASDGKRGITSE